MENDAPKRPDPIILQVIRAEELRPGDMVVIKCSKDQFENASRWASHIFKGYNCRIAVVYDNIQIDIIQYEPDTKCTICNFELKNCQCQQI